MRGIAVELIVLLALQTLGTSIFARFEVETPISRRLLKWTIFTCIVSEFLQRSHSKCALRVGNPTRREIP